ncbi:MULTISPECIES: helix-turn-helix transcriptional regulator [Streptomyces]|uniref:helix-turn-helix transcriptional regulator n=2 Tax=Streptomyces TaxID=1883 RepID=UPI00364F858B
MQCASLKSGDALLRLRGRASPIRSDAPRALPQGNPNHVPICDTPCPISRRGVQWTPCCPLRKLRGGVMAVAVRPGVKLTVDEVCDELGVARSTFYDWRQKGRGPRCIRLPNGSLRIRRSDFENWLIDCEDPS